MKRYLTICYPIGIPFIRFGVAALALTFGSWTAMARSPFDAAPVSSPKEKSRSPFDDAGPEAKSSETHKRPPVKTPDESRTTRSVPIHPQSKPVVPPVQAPVNWVPTTPPLPSPAPNKATPNPQPSSPTVEPKPSTGPLQNPFPLIEVDQRPSRLPDPIDSSFNPRPQTPSPFPPAIPDFDIPRRDPVSEARQRRIDEAVARGRALHAQREANDAAAVSAGAARGMQRATEDVINYITAPVIIIDP